jgi:hypothetical protein
MSFKPKCSKKDVLAALKKCKGKTYLAAVELKVTIRTVQYYAQRWPEVKEAIEEQRGLLLDTAERMLYRAIEKGEPWAICFFLKCQGKARGYIEKYDVGIGGIPGAPPVQSLAVSLLLKSDKGQELLGNIAEEMAATSKPLLLTRAVNGEPVTNGNQSAQTEVDEPGTPET